MAVRSGAGTGVIVSLVVFVLTTVFLLILTIVFYAGKNEALEQAKDAKSNLTTYVKDRQRNSDEFKRYEQAAQSNRKSVAAYLAGRSDDLMRFVAGDASLSIDELRARVERSGVGENDTIAGALEAQGGTLRRSEGEMDSLRATLADREAELAEKQTQLSDAREAHERELEEVGREIATYREASAQFSTDLRDTIFQMNQAVDRQEEDFRLREGELEEEIDSLNQELVLLRARVDEFEKILADLRIKAKDPALLVDGLVIDVEPASDQVFIDRGRQDRIVLGMTFEVYDDVASIRVDPRTGSLPRGKASIQVVKVGDTTSTCEITRAVPGRPVVRNNVIANAVYDPEYVFKFLVHGKFDADGDGRPSEAEAEFLRSLVVRWGGEIVIGEELPGDLDFLVLGDPPPMPAPLRPDANQAQIDIWARQRATRLKYDELFRRASEAQIPVLNANRFFVLIGRAER